MPTWWEIQSKCSGSPELMICPFNKDMNSANGWRCTGVHNCDLIWSWQQRMIWPLLGLLLSRYKGLLYRWWLPTYGLTLWFTTYLVYRCIQLTDHFFMYYLVGIMYVQVYTSELLMCTQLYCCKGDDHQRLGWPDLDGLQASLEPRRKWTKGHKTWICDGQA